MRGGFIFRCARLLLLAIALVPLVAAESPAEILASLDASIAKDKDNWSLYFKRAATSLQYGQDQQALDDFTKVLELKPEFHQARLYRGRLHKRDGRLDEAFEDFNAIEATASAEKEEVAESLEHIINARAWLKEVESAERKEQWSVVAEKATELLKVSPHQYEWRLKRADAYTKLGDWSNAAADLTRASKLQPHRLDTYVNIGSLQLKAGDVEVAKNAFRDCLKQDPDNRACMKNLKAVKKLEKKVAAVEKSFKAGVFSKATKVADILEDCATLEVGDKFKMRLWTVACTAFAKIKEYGNANKYCDLVLKVTPDSVTTLLQRADNYIQLENYDAALRDYKRAHELDPQNPKVHEGYHTAQKLQQRASQVDYYQVLGVKRSATDREIKRAHKKLAQEWHPDKYRGDLPPEKVAEKMAEINKAYEVLKDPELKEQYDRGDDPMAQNGGQSHSHHGNPFAFFPGGGGGFPFSGGNGGGFKFKFGGNGGGFHQEF